MKKINILRELIIAAEPDAKKFFESSNKVAGTRLRNRMQEIKKMCQAIRLDVNEAKKKKL